MSVLCAGSGRKILSVSIMLLSSLRQFSVRWGGQPGRRWHSCLAQRSIAT